MKSMRRYGFALGGMLFFAFASAVAAQTVRGKVRLDPRGEPARHVIVVFVQQGAEKARAITDARGFYYVPNLSPGNYDVRLLRQNTVQTRNARVPAAGGTFDFRIPER